MATAAAPCPQCGYDNRPGALLCNLCQRVLVRTATSERIEQRLERRRDFFAEIGANQRRSAVLLILVIALLLVVGATTGEAVAPGGWPYGIGVAAVLALVIGFVAYFQGNRIVLAASGARPVTRDAEPQIHNIVEEMAIAAGLPTPAVYLIDDSAPNAFATGRDPQHAAITVTRGLLHKLNREELQGVIGHEMSHIRNLDIRY